MADDIPQGFQEENLTKKERREVRKQEKQERRDEDAKKRARNRLLMWALFAVAAAGVIWLFMQLSKKPDNVTGENLPVDAVSELDHSKGNDQASLVLIEYSDFQCPACGNAYPMVKQLMEEKGNDVHFVYRHFPLKSIHPNAQAAAWAAEAASRQGKFWEMHNMLFDTQDTWSQDRRARDRFVEYAKQLGLNEDQFVRDMDSDDVHNAVENSYQSGIRAQVNATPTFFLNGKKLSPPKTYDDLKKAVEDAKQQ